MISRRLNEFSAVVLMVYLSAVVAGGLHHHEPADSAGPQDCAADRSFSAGSHLVLSHDESDDCTVCAASHQAKAPPVVVLLAETYRVVGDCLVFPVQSAAVSIPRITQARAPPLV